MQPLPVVPKVHFPFLLLDLVFRMAFTSVITSGVATTGLDLSGGSRSSTTPLHNTFDAKRLRQCGCRSTMYAWSTVVSGRGNGVATGKRFVRPCKCMRSIKRMGDEVSVTRTVTYTCNRLHHKLTRLEGNNIPNCFPRTCPEGETLILEGLRVPREVESPGAGSRKDLISSTLDHGPLASPVLPLHCIIKCHISSVL